MLKKLNKYVPLTNVFEFLIKTRWGIVCFILFTSCDNFSFSKQTNDPVLAEAYGEYLLKSDVPFSKTAQNLSKEDSMVFINSFVNSWIENKVMLEKASINVDEEYLDLIEQKLIEYKNSLMIFEYEKKLILQNIDTTVTEEELTQYYTENEDNFKLNESIVRCLFVKIQKNSPSVKEFINHYTLKSSEDSIFIHDMAKLEAEKFFIDYDVWRKLDYVLSELPLAKKMTDSQVFIQNNKNTVLEDENYVYLLTILEHKSPGTLAPLSYLKENIQLMIVNQRKYAYLKNIRKRLIESSIKKNEVTVYEK